MTTTSTGAPDTAGTQDSPLDLLIVGAGIAGIDLAHHVAEAFPAWQWEIHDVQSDVGGTWHTFRYPGIRSDSDMATFGFPFHQWPHASTLGEGPEIKEYIRDAARASGALDRLHLRSYIAKADWDSSKGLFRVTAESRTGDGESERPAERIIWARRVHFGAGYYSHDNGYRPRYPDEEEFGGQIIHPQQWPEDLDCAGKKIVIIGSGATAVTLLPALADLGADVTMLQRTPTYIGPLPEVDIISRIWKTVLPEKAAYKVARFNHGARDMMQYVVAQRAPWLFKAVLRLMQRRFISAEVLDKHFSPDYRPWDQRVCKAPNGDIFTAIAGGAKVVTDHIDGFTRQGIRVSSGEEIEADIVISATGLELQAFGGGTLAIDGEELDATKLTAYRGLMLGGVPNFSFTIGYVNASWTLRADMVSKYMVKLWKTGVRTYAPVPPETPSTRPLLDLDAGYVKRGGHLLPRQGESRPWQYIQNYLVEIPTFNFGDQHREMAFDDAVPGVLARGNDHSGAVSTGTHKAPAEALAERA
ncbi:flavin-containing monooxygenase [Dietzia timorensis]|uniref:FAD-containing monooxygenase EthA n=1 Tax=Dietzia timorensis TaxID=499555 RepID=A0A173LM34_9ACTN|nr:NAD(P)/FAD-dependent oxidoreductase [Dietzia timorensis]ANI92953.1 FAD-containing monooxygenase EthA [Dietzia timorensis]